MRSCFDGKIEILCSWGICDVIAVRFSFKSFILLYLVLIAAWIHLICVRFVASMACVWKAITRFVAFASICGVCSRHNSFRLHRQNLGKFVREKFVRFRTKEQYSKQLLHAIYSVTDRFSTSKSLAKCFGFARFYQKWTIRRT